MSGKRKRNESTTSYTFNESSGTTAKATTDFATMNAAVQEYMKSTILISLSGSHVGGEIEEEKLLKLVSKTFQENVQCKHEERINYFQVALEELIQDNKRSANCTFKTGEWTNEELQDLKYLVPLNQKTPKGQYSTTVGTLTDWKNISQILNRSPADCNNKYRLTVKTKNPELKKGPFTAEEDAVIRNYVADVCEGVVSRQTWYELGKQMKRESGSLKHRWTAMQSARTNINKPSVKWTPELDEQLRQAHAEHGHHRYKWKEIAEHVHGENVTPKSCQHRWTYFLDPTVSSRNRAQWTEEEVVQLRNLVPDHIYADSLGNDKTNWTAVSKALNRQYDDCKAKWTALQICAHNAQVSGAAPFTPAEDALINTVFEMSKLSSSPIAKHKGSSGAVEKVLKRTRGMLTGLEKDLGRDRKTIQNRLRRQLLLGADEERE